MLQSLPQRFPIAMFMPAAHHLTSRWNTNTPTGSASVLPNVSPRWTILTSILLRHRSVNRNWLLEPGPLLCKRFCSRYDSRNCLASSACEIICASVHATHEHRPHQGFGLPRQFPRKFHSTLQHDRESSLSPDREAATVLHMITFTEQSKKKEPKESGHQDKVPDERRHKSSRK